MFRDRKKLGAGARIFVLVPVIAGAALAGGCEDWLDVTDPGALEDPALRNEENINLMMDGVIGDFQEAFAWTALFSGVFVDELRNHHGYFENGEFDLREVNDNNGTYTLAVYNGLHRARFLADSVASRIRTLLADSAGRDLRLARVLAYAGYSYIMLGEQMCESPINLGPPLPSSELLGMGQTRFTDAIEVATAARAAATSDALTAAADSVLNFARVGAARAALDLGDAAAASGFASAVEPAYGSPAAPGFAYYAWYVDGANASERRRIGNPYWEFVTSGRWFSVSGTQFENLDDPRVPHADSTLAAADGTRRFVPNSPLAFSTYDGTLEGAPFEATSSIRIASALEARYILAEIEGATAENVAFVNERRAIGGQGALVAPAADAYVVALREQRARDLFIDGHRLGDLRRYKEQYGEDLFEHGAYYGSATDVFGDQECWPIPLAEKTGNPNF
ncbi:MAG: hypothetical protein ACRELX_06705 [Longimicrobiales bacterium]